MRKSKLKFTFILLLMAIAYSVILGSGVVCAVEQRESTDVSVNPRAENSSASTKLAIAGIGILSLTGLLVSGFLYQQRRTRARRAIEQLDRFREEFLCGPLAEHYQSRYQQNQPTAKSQETLVTPTPPIVNANTEPNPTTDKSIKEPTIFERYQNLIAEIVATALKGQIRSKEYIYRQLVANVSSGTSEIFERSLSDRLNTTQTELDNTTNSPSFFKRETPELKKARLSRTIKALQSIQTEWERLQKQKRNQAVVIAATEKILAASDVSRFSVLLQIIDPNQSEVFNHSQLQQLAQELAQAADNSDDLATKEEIEQLASGISRGMASYHQLEASLVRWIYEPQQGSLELSPTSSLEPWATWATQTHSSFPQMLFYVLASGRSAVEVVLSLSYIDMRDWVELAVILQSIQQGLVSWFEKQPYDSQWGTSASTTTFLSFAIVWCELCSGLNQASHIEQTTAQQLAKDCFQIVLQMLRTFAHREYFPLYGGMFASFGRDYLQDAVSYLDKPLREVEGTHEKARILTLLGYSQRILGKYEQAEAFHQEALEIAQQAGDQACEIANLNHKSQVCIARKDYSGAINYSQRALILARQIGDRLGEGHALATLGCGEVFAMQQLERIEPDVYKKAIQYLQRGLQLQLSPKLTPPFGKSLASHQTLALYYNSLGIAYLALDKLQTALDYLEEGVEAAQYSGDKYLQGLNFLYLAESHYKLNKLEAAVHNGCLAMYVLHEITAVEWRQAAGLITILQGQLGDGIFKYFLAKYRNNIIKYIGVDGYDYLPELLDKYQRSH